MTDKTAASVKEENAAALVVEGAGAEATGVVDVDVDVDMGNETQVDRPSTRQRQLSASGLSNQLSHQQQHHHSRQD